MTKFFNLSKSEKEFIDKLYADFYSLFFAIAFEILRNISEAEDAVSEAFIKISKNIKKIIGFSCNEIRSYCVVIVRNEAMNILRKRKKYIFTDDVKPVMDDLYYEDSLEDVVENKLMNERLFKYVNDLSKQEQEMLKMRFYEDMSYKEIAGRMGISEDNARVRVYRIIEKLRKSYKGDEV